MKQNTHGFQKQEYRNILSQEEIIALKKESGQRSGRWEIDWGPEPISQALGNSKEELILTMVVHQESYYIIATEVTTSDKIGKGKSVFIAAVKKEFKLPETVVVRNSVLQEELMSLAEALDFKIEVGPLKAIPEVRRGMKRMFS